MKPSYLQDQIIRGMLMSGILQIINYKGFDKEEESDIHFNINEESMSCYNYIKELAPTFKFFIKEYEKEFIDSKGDTFPTKEFLDKIDLFGLYVWYMGSLEVEDKSFLTCPEIVSNKNVVYKNIINLLKNKFNIRTKAYTHGTTINRKLILDDWKELFFLIDKFIPKVIRKELVYGKLAYLAGPMEYSAGEGLEWRREFATKLSKLGYKSIVPNDEEKTIKAKYDVTLESKKNNVEEYITGVREFMILDLTFVEAADCIVCKWEGERCSGTVHEVGFARQIGTPSYLVTTQPLEEVPGWFLACFTKCFKHIDDLIAYLEAPTK